MTDIELLARSRLLDAIADLPQNARVMVLAGDVRALLDLTAASLAPADADAPFISGEHQ